MVCTRLLVNCFFGRMERAAALILVECGRGSDTVGVRYPELHRRHHRQDRIRGGQPTTREGIPE